MEKPKLKIFIVYHKNLFFEHYEKDENFSSDYYTFCKIDRLENKFADLPNMLDVNKLPNFIQLDSQYNEYQAIYNIYNHPELWKDLDYIGFSQYDKPHTLRSNDEHNVTELILNNLGPDNHISLESYPFSVDYSQNILMDENQPEKLHGEGKNAYIGILEDYNEFHNTTYTLNDLWNKSINLVSSFILPVKYFENVMKFIAYIISIGKLNQFDTLKRYRIQAGLLERYMGVAILFENLEHVDLSTEHLNQK